MESTFNGYWLVDGLRAHEYPAVLANPARMRANIRLKHADDRSDAEFLARQQTMGVLPERYGVEVHAYALMGNHYHLLIRALHARASAAIQWRNVSYSVGFNRRRSRVGRVFQGRFGSTLVDGEGTWA